MMNALRLSDGFELSLFEQRTGLPMASIEQLLLKHKKQGLINIDHNKLRLSTRGKQMVNNMLQDYLPD